MAFTRSLPLRQASYVSLNNTLFFSILLHAVVLALLFFVSPTPAPMPKWTFDPVYSVRLVSSSPNFTGETVLPSGFSREIFESASRSRSFVVKKPVDDFSPASAKKIELQKQQVMPLDRVLDEIKRKVALKNIRTAVSKAGVTDNPPNQATESEINARMNEYYAMVWMRIKGRWAFPKSMLSNRNMEAVVHVRILRSGDIADLWYEKSSGNKYFDESALKAVKKANPFPPLPEFIPDKSVEVGIRFHGSEAD
jgi:TonB family protein